VKYARATKLRDALITSEGFQPHKTMRQRLLYKEGPLIDLVPFGALERATGEIAWSPDFSIVMSTVGFRESYANSIDVRLADGEAHRSRRFLRGPAPEERSVPRSKV
jgi:predicted nucleotidyltransferase